MRKLLLHIASASIFFTSLIAIGNASEIQPVANLIDERLSHMKAVALFKEANHIPIEDLVQEERVIKRSLDRAQKLGLDPETVKPFIDIQMKAAKAVQYRYRADWLFKGYTIYAPETLDNERKQIAELGDKLLEIIAQRLKQRIHIEKSDQASFVNSLSAYNLQDEEKLQIFDALHQIKLAQR
ncbi:chorismate mutase [Brucella gallinifaecis]|uniref:chorismate mutase n=1 Tax=Brucella gallinifaecis TaxID=215590 RepID=UPI00235FBCD4|nr:chorismate mutase [Brucella gallinifaecis]